MYWNFTRIHFCEFEKFYIARYKFREFSSLTKLNPRGDLSTSMTERDSSNKGDDWSN